MRCTKILLRFESLNASIWFIKYFISWKTMMFDCSQKIFNVNIYFLITSLNLISNVEHIVKG